MKIAWIKLKWIDQSLMCCLTEYGYVYQYDGENFN